MNGSAGPKVTVLYKISNVKGEEGCYNAFELPGSAGGISLSTVKNNCHALRHLNSAGANGYHWRVRVDDKSTIPKASPKYSWWDIQDDAARLPVKEVGFSELQNMLSPPTRKSVVESSTSASKGGVVRSLGKAMNKVAASVEGTTSSTFDGPGAPRVPILMFKLLDLVKLHDEHSSTARFPTRVAAPQHSRPVRQPDPRPSTTSTNKPKQPTSGAPQRRRQQQPPAATATSAPEGSLMDFGPGPTTKTTPSHSHSAPASFGSTPPATSNETRAQKLKREYEKKKQTENRVWDEVDQRWVTVEAKNGATVNRGSTSAPPSVVASSSSQNNASKPKVKGISLDQANTIGKSANVAAAVQSRVNEMKSSQEKALAQIREREEAKKKSEAEEDIVRQKLEPKIKAWSEEHGKKKQLRALLASLHTILWPDAKWKQVNLGDLLDDRKVKLSFHKASRVVHPDKTMNLPAEQRFLAKRIFDALSQAKTEFDK